ncbi:hypothetical protein GJ629_08175 [Halapricum sp. CBA1109]|uniref:hypothetical protein n=1 Tax=Halapricum sp. CBA1109 TaxID=2668068 RepID=UPI0012F755CC|nr:hypothetical protein [Halapricum sp. CBA1109]MUV89874.1 hypothetical protein [Halapricum sp. CBA1109]
MQRRRLLRSVGGIAAVTSTTLLAGCSGDDGSDEQEDDDDEDDDATDDQQPADGTGPASGLGSGGDSEAPSANFEMDYSEGEPIAESSADGYVEITHANGDAIPAESLVVQGTGVYPRGDGRWPNQYVDGSGATDSSVGDVTAGVGIAVDVDSDYQVQVVWNPPQEVSSTVLSEQSGPDA